MSFTIPRIILEMNPRIVPIRNGKKGPTTKGWPDVTTRASDLVDDDGVFECSDHDAYGVVIDEDMIIVDVDKHDGQENGFDSLDAIRDDVGLDLWMEAKLIVRTPSGGAHLYFRKSAADKLAKTCSKYPSIDLLQKGSQAVGPGSRDGGYWVECDGLPSDIDVRLADAWGPEPVKHTKAKLVDYGDPSDFGDRTLGDSPRDSFDQSIEGVKVLRALMESVGYVFHDSGDHYTYTRPYKTDHSFSISGTLGRVNKAGKPYLKNFSTSDPFLEADSFSLSEAYKRISGFGDHELLTDLESKGFKGDNRYDVDAVREFAEEWARDRRARTTGEEINKQYPTYTLSELQESTSGASRREYVIENLLRRGEVMNVIAAPKVGKSWLVYNLAVCAATGKEFLGYKPSGSLKVLIVDNELHPEELAWRVTRVAESLGSDVGDNLQFAILRGSSVDIDGLDRKLEECGGSQYDIIVIDAFYRILPKGMSENDNAAMTQIYNKLDRLARKNEASIINIHHSSKGNQGDKGVTDVGAGAGAISRAADTHLVIREHVDAGKFVLEAVTRSGLSPQPAVAFLDWPVWRYDENAEPTVKSFENCRDKRHKDAKEDIEAKHQIILECLQDAGTDVVSTVLFEDCKMETWPNEVTFKKHLKEMAKKGMIKELPPVSGKALRWIAR